MATECVLCLLDEVNHFEWRRKAQRFGAHNHQHLENYRDLILSKFSTLQSIHNCSIHQGLFPKALKFWEDSEKNIDYEKIAEEFLKKINEIYSLWNSGDTSGATENLQNIIVDIETAKERENNCDINDLPLFLFRERIDGETSKDGLWHIPFDERYKVRNYRYSISGRPMLYLGSSIVDIVYEMRQENCVDKSKHMVSTFLRKQDLNIFDLTNHFPLYLRTTWALAGGGSKITFDDTLYAAKKYIPIYFKLLLLMSCCSFSTLHEEATFHEEYIIPQLLTEILQKRGYEGIRYSSTRLNPKLFEKENQTLWHENYFRENFVLFTKYEDNQRHDILLKNKFENYSPKSMKIYSNENASERLNTFIKELVPYINSGGISGLNKDLSQTLIPYLTRLESLKFNGLLYTDTDYGKFEINSIIDTYKEYIKGLLTQNSKYLPLYKKISGI